MRVSVDLKENYCGANQAYCTSQGVLNLNPNESAPSPKQMSKTQTDEYIVGVVFAQHFNLKKGLELFGDAADVAVKKELSHIHELSTYEPLALSELTSQERKDALEYLMFITEKRNGDIKARNVADGSKQRMYAGY